MTTTQYLSLNLIAIFCCKKKKKLSLRRDKKIHETKRNKVSDFYDFRKKERVLVK